MVARGVENRSSSKPFVEVQQGEKKGEWAGKRKCDRIANGESLYAVGNSARQVGKAALQFWMEILLPLQDKLEGKLAVWPFNSIDEASVIIGECYPRLCQQTLYGRNVSKRDAQKVVDALAKYRESDPDQLAISDTVWMHAASSEDEFDMFTTSVALARWFSNDSTPFKCPTDREVKHLEGWILGMESDAEPQQSNQRENRTSVNSSKKFACPISGCKKVFDGSRGGWDSHVASLQNHPEWNPKLTLPLERKAQFRKEFPGFFL